MTARLRVRALLCAEGDSDVHVQHWDVCCVYWTSWKAELKRWVRCWLSEGGLGQAIIGKGGLGIYKAQGSPVTGKLRSL